MKSLNKALSSLAIVILILSGLGMRPLFPMIHTGAYLLVNTPDDEFDEGDQNQNCSLREAVEAANTDQDFGGCHKIIGTYGHDDYIRFTTGYTTFNVNRTSGEATDEDLNRFGDLDIKEKTGLSLYPEVTIEGNGYSKTILDASDTDRIFDIQENAKVVITGLTIRDGQTFPDSKSGNGGGIYNAGNLTIKDSQILSNVGAQSNLTGYPTGRGGGIYSDGGLHIFNTTISDNWAGSSWDTFSGGDGGGIYIESGSDMVEIHTSSLSWNHAGPAYYGPGKGGQGGGIYNAGDDTEIVASTFYKNYAGGGGAEEVMGAGDGGDGGGIYNDNGILTIINCTLTENEAGYSNHFLAGSGGALANVDGTVNIYEATITKNKTTASSNSGDAGGIESSAANSSTYIYNTILALNINWKEPQVNDCHTGTSVTNIFEAYSSIIGSINGCDLDVSESVDVGSNPLLDILGDYGGPTQTMRLLADSPAIDTGSADYCDPTDQRGYPRPADPLMTGTDLCDIGAFELQPLWNFLPLIKK